MKPRVQITNLKFTANIQYSVLLKKKFSVYKYEGSGSEFWILILIFYVLSLRTRFRKGSVSWYPSFYKNFQTSVQKQYSRDLGLIYPELKA